MYIPTREVIGKALMELLRTASLDKITVRMVCDRAGVSRQALYNHYYGLLDVFEDILTGLLSRAVQGSDTYLTWDSGFERILKCLDENRAMLLHVYHSGCRGELIKMLERYGGKLISRGIAECARDMKTEVSQQDQKFMLDLYLYAFMGVIDHWLAQGMQLSPAYITSRCNAMMSLSIRGTLRRLTEENAKAPLTNYGKYPSP